MFIASCNMSSFIHWYPGHMKKAANEMLGALKMVDVVLELVDARAPKQTSNPFFKTIIRDKPCVKVYMKSDLADLSAVKLPANGILVSIKDPYSVKRLTKKIMEAYQSKAEKQIKRGIKPLPPKAMVVGIPNIGKSSLINALVKKKITKVENKPGLTKNQRWVNVNNAFYLLDTPGILPSNYDNDNYVLALIGAVKTTLLPVIKLSDYAYTYLTKHYPALYKKRYGEIKKDSNDAFALIASKRGIKNDKTIHHEAVRSLFLKEIRDGKIGRIYFA